MNGSERIVLNVLMVVTKCIKCNNGSERSVLDVLTVMNQVY